MTREVAVRQILDSHAVDPASRARFVLEAEITGGLEHPGIVPVYGLGTYGDGRPYYAMRFIRGETFKESIGHFHVDESVKNDVGRRSRWMLPLLRRFMDVCNAIGYAHSRGVLHRDIKPANVIVGTHGETLMVDWGLAKATGKSDTSADERVLLPKSADGSSETLPGSALGTPAYMSPEQAEGNLEALGPHSDLFSLGATLYCLLTGKPPVDGGDIGSVLRAVQRGEFAARSAAGAPRLPASADGPGLPERPVRARPLRSMSSGRPTAREPDEGLLKKTPTGTSHRPSIGKSPTPAAISATRSQFPPFHREKLDWSQPLGCTMVKNDLVSEGTSRRDERTGPSTYRPHAGALRRRNVRRTD